MNDKDWNYYTAALDVICPRCRVEQGQKCRTASGRIAERPHIDRVEPLVIAFGEGYLEGRDEH